VERGHDVTVYCNNVEPDHDLSFNYEVLRYPKEFPHDVWEGINNAIKGRKDELKEYDIVHSYLMETIPSISRINFGSTKTIVTLNAYAGICPKNDLRYKGASGCEKNGYLRCGKCTIYEDTVKEPLEEPNLLSRIAKTAYSPIQKLRRLRLINSSSEKDKINVYHALSDHIKSAYVDFDYPKSSIEVIPNILDQDFIVEHKSNFQSPYRLLYVGYLRSHKGVDRLVPMLSKIVERTEDKVTLTIVGDGEERTKMEEQAKSHQLESNIAFKGHLPYETLPSVYASHDLFVYPGKWDEPFGRVFLEALATQTPILSTDVGAASEIIGNGGTVAKNDTDSLVDALVEILEPETLERYSRSGQTQVQKYKRHNIVDGFEHIYGL